MFIQVLGIDLGKSCFHIVGRDAAGNTQFKKKLSRSKLCEFLANHPKCIVAFEACGGAHWLARKCSEFGHKPKAIPLNLLKPTLKAIRTILMMRKPLLKLPLDQTCILFLLNLKMLR